MASDEPAGSDVTDLAGNDAAAAEPMGAPAAEPLGAPMVEPIGAPVAEPIDAPAAEPVSVLAELVARHRPDSRRLRRLIALLTEEPLDTATLVQRSALPRQR